MKKSLLSRMPVGYAELVVAHARYQKTRGRNPSMSFADIRNPRLALKEALKVADSRPKVKTGAICSAGIVSGPYQLEEVRKNPGVYRTYNLGLSSAGVVHMADGRILYVNCNYVCAFETWIVSKDCQYWLTDEPLPGEIVNDY